jgi:hypothetical protein
MLGRVTMADPHIPGAPTNYQHVVGLYPCEAKGHWRDHVSKIKGPLIYSLFIDRVIHACLAPKAPGFLNWAVLIIQN